jgi:AcrR family transcriptional regulator
MQERLTRQERRSQTRDRLIDAAATVFARRGFETATLDEVAATAGFTKGAVYSNFASKTDLFIALIERRIEVQTAELSARYGGQDLAAAARRLQNPPDREPESERQWLLLAIEFWLHAMRDERARALMAQQYERARLASADLIASFFEVSGQKPPMAPRDLAIAMEAVSVGLAIQAALDPEAVRMSLQGEVIARLVGVPLPGPEPVPPAAAPGAPGAPGAS